MASWLGLALTLAVVFAGGVLGGMARFALTRLIDNARAATFAATEIAEKVVKPPRKPAPHNGPGLYRPMAKQPAMLTAKVSASAAVVPGAAP